MLTIFRTNQPFTNVFLLVYLLVVRASLFVHVPASVPRSQSILTQWLYMELPPNGTLALIFALLLVFIQAVFINITVSRFRIATDVSLLPGLFYCLVTSFMPEFLTLSPIVLGNTFLILAVYYLLDVYKNNYVAGRIFDAGFWIGLASLFHFSFLAFFFWGIVGLSILRGINVRELLMFIVGLLVPFFLFGTYLFWNDNLALLFTYFKANLGWLSFVKLANPTVYFKIGFMSLLVIIVLLMSGGLFARRNIASQKSLSIVYWLLLVAAITVLFQMHIELSHWLITAIPIAILLSMIFQRINAATAEAVHMLMVAVALVLQFEYILG